MTIKSVIDVQVNDDQFAAFHALFKDYESALENMPAGWKEVGGAINSTTEGLGKAASETHANMKLSAMQAAVLGNGLKNAIKAQNEFQKSTVRSGSAMSKLVKSTKELGGDIFGISKFMIKITALGASIFGGFLFGLDKLAGSVMNTQSAARGVGAGTGQIKAFGLNYQNFLDPGATLANIAHAKTDAMGQYWLGQKAGMSSDQVMSTDAVTLAMKSTLALHDWASALPNKGAMMSQIFPSTGFDKLGFSIEDAIRIKNTPRNE